MESHFAGGKIDSSLIHLQYLRHLDLSVNNFSSMIPEFFGSFEHLEYLNLSSAWFGGKIPHQLGNLSNLHTLDLNSFDNLLLVDNLSWLSSLSSLLHLDLSWVNLSKVENWMQEINQLSSLTELHLQYCRLPKIHSPFPFPNLTASLNVLDLSRNNFILTSVPHWLTNFSNLTHLYLGNIGLHCSIPSAMGNLTKLEVLDLSDNSINGTVPKSFSNLCHLRILDFSFNSISGMEKIPRCLANSLEVLNLVGNQLEENLNVWLGEIRDSKTLKTLSLSDNSFSGYIPSPSERVMFPSELKFLFLGGNKFSGYILQSFGNLLNLVTLDISNNSFPIVITEDVLSNLERLEDIHLSDNQLVWEVNSRWLPPNIRRIFMSSCQVGPKFPLWLQHHKDVSLLNLSNSSISDDVPNWFWKIVVNMIDLALPDNQLRGYLPNGMSTWQMGSLDLSNNSFFGSIPRDLCMLKNLQILDLSSNHFSGDVPDCWEMGGRTLWYINLSNNILSGEVPPSLGNLPFLAFLHMRNNSLSGEISSKTKNMKNLVVLDLAYNRLSGVIPTWDVGENLLSLRILSLRSNMIHGNIPSKISLLSSLQFLDLSQNNISGSIPASFGNFSSMARTHNEKDQFFWYNTSKYVARTHDKVWMTLKGVELEISGNLGIRNVMDLSSNNLSGDIPEELMHLLGLDSLNLSWNSLKGHIPNKIGALMQLESLDLSKNKFSGEIPSSISMLYSLSKLNLSYNNLSGSIPSGFQLQTLVDSSIYIGNDNLCGPLLPKKCPTIETPLNDIGKVGNNEGEINDESEILWLFISVWLCGWILGILWHSNFQEIMEECLLPIFR